MTPQDLIKQYEKALESQNWSNVEPLLHDDVCVTFSTGTFKGKPDVQKVFETNFDLIKEEKYSISDLHWVFQNKNIAVCLYCFNWEGVINGQVCAGGGRGTTVLTHSTGDWQILTEHLGPHSN